MNKWIDELNRLILRCPELDFYVNQLIDPPQCV